MEQVLEKPARWVRRKLALVSEDPLEKWLEATREEFDVEVPEGYRSEEY